MATFIVSLGLFLHNLDITPLTNILDSFSDMESVIEMKWLQIKRKINKRNQTRNNNQNNNRNNNRNNNNS